MNFSGFQKKIISVFHAILLFTVLFALTIYAIALFGNSSVVLLSGPLIALGVAIAGTWFILKRRFFLKAWSAIVGIACIISAVWLIRWQFFTPRWDAIFYTYANRGFNPIFEGSYWTENECIEKTKKLLDSKTILIDGKYKSSTFFCGKDCSFKEMFGSVAIHEIECTEGLVPRPNSN